MAKKSFVLHPINPGWNVCPPRDKPPFSTGNEFGLRDLAKVCFYILLKQVEPAFPGAHRAAPSRIVRVITTSATSKIQRNGDLYLFPFEIGWRHYHFAVEPVLNNSRFNMATEINRFFVSTGKQDKIIDGIELELIKSFQTQQFLPLSL